MSKWLVYILPGYRLTGMKIAEPGFIQYRMTAPNFLMLVIEADSAEKATWLASIEYGNSVTKAVKAGDAYA